MALGGRGFTMERDDDGNWVRGQHLGGVIIGNRVHLAEFVVVNRATLEGDATIVGEDSKLAPLVLVGHNCKIGKHVFIGPHVCLHGSVEVGELSALKVERSVCWPLRIVFEDAAGQNGVESRVDLPPVQ